MAKHLVEEKSESGSTLARAGAFWAILALPLLLWRKLRKK
jgi:hypothetical protein